MALFRVYGLLGLSLVSSPAHALCVGGPPDVRPADGAEVPRNLAFQVTPQLGCEPRTIVVEIDGQELRQDPDETLAERHFVLPAELMPGEHSFVVRDEPTTWRVRRSLVVLDSYGEPPPDPVIVSLEASRARVEGGQHAIQFELASAFPESVDAYTLFYIRRDEDTDWVSWPQRGPIFQRPPRFQGQSTVDDVPDEICVELVRVGITGESSASEACSRPIRGSGCSTAAAPATWAGLAMLLMLRVRRGST